MYLYIRMLLSMAVTLYTSRVVLEVLGVRDFGVYTIVGGVVALFSFFNNAMSSATQRFLSFDLGKGDLINLKKTFNATLNIHIAIGLSIVLLAETIGLWFVTTKLNIPSERMSAVHWIYQFSILTFFVGVVQVPYNALIIARERMNIYAAMSIVEVVLKLLIVYLLVIINADKLILYAALIFLVSFSVASFYRIYCHRHFEESKYQFHYDRAMYKTLIAYSGWNLFGNIAAVAKGHGTNILLNLFFGPLINAAYGITMQVQAAISVFVKNFQLAFNPQIVKTYAAGDTEQSLQLIFQSAKFSFFLMLILISPVVFNVDFILALWLIDVPDYTAIFVVLCLVTVLIDSIAGPLMIGIQATGKIKWYQIVVGTILFLNLPISYWLLTIYHEPFYVFYSSIVLASVSMFLRILFLKKMMPFKTSFFLNFVIYRIFGVTALAIFFLFLLNQVFNNRDDFLGFIASSSITLISNLVVIYLIGLDRKEKLFIKNFIKTKLK